MNKLDLIIDALARSVPVVWTDKHQADRHMEALAYARELRALEPVARFNWNEAKFEWLTEYNYDKHHLTPLFALDKP